MTRALYPGSFDPLHLGHLDVIEQAAELFDEVVVAVMHNPSKPSGRFTVEQRVVVARASVVHLGGVSVEAFEGLAVQAASLAGVDVIVKGLRTAGDFEIEQQMAHTNHSVTGIRTVFVAGRPERSFISSRFIREIAHYGGAVRHLVPDAVAALFEETRP